MAESLQTFATAVGWFHPTQLPSRMSSSTFTIIKDTMANYTEPVDRAEN
ncbi:MAG: hypothetical protein IZT55_04410 [Anaerolineae bacterium]|nr:hypothetical protein [Anaerolineae bacterium]